MEYYRIFKKSFQYEKYIDCITKVNRSKYMSRFRLSLPNLEWKLGDILVL